MKRIEIIYEKIKELDKGNGVCALEIAEALKLSRANVSSDLNRLCEDGKVVKNNGRPVLFNVVELNTPKKEMTTFDRFTSKNPSLFSAIEQAKAAILYPPRGMHILIIGETGVGKSMFAELVHRYAIEMNKKDENAPFVVFNCADYANNPQLLLSQLFGTKKGAFTGADADKPGLIEKADGGILLLDEVHRLPPEGQEMFFTFLDRGTYRRLGETELDRTANIIIISATTEDPSSVLLKTFTRRIPMIIQMPNLKERSFDERLNLISGFMREESARLGRKIELSINSMKALLTYNCTNNVGQLKTDIQLVCAKAYADFVSHRKDNIRISSLDLPQHILKGLYMETEHRQLWNKLIDINIRYCIFDYSEENIIFEEEKNEESIYDMIDIRVCELKSKGMNSDELEKEMEKDIEEYFNKYIYSVYKKVDVSNLENVIGHEIIRVVEEIIEYSQERLKKVFCKKVHLGMAFHIATAIERVKMNRKIINPQLNKIRTCYIEEFSTAIDCIKIIDNVFEISMPIDEAGFIAMFFTYDNREIVEQKNDVKVIVIAHGTSTATSMAKAANNILGVIYAYGINASLDESPDQVLKNLKLFIKEAEIKSEILLLVDMGSLTNFGDEIEKELGIRTKTIPLVSTLHVIEATRKALLGYSLEELYEDTMNVNTLLDNIVAVSKEAHENKEQLAIVTICTTGEGGAVAIENFLIKQFELDRNIFKILPVNLIGNESIDLRLEKIKREYKIVCIITSFDINTNIAQFGLNEVLSQKAVKSIQELIDIETTYYKIGETLENMLKNMNGKDVVSDIKEFIDNIEGHLNIRTNTNILIGIMLHIACMLDRLLEGENVSSFENKALFIATHPELYGVIKKACEILNKKYNVKISEDEICYIMAFFNDKNYI